MVNRITVTIDGLDYTVISEDGEENIRECAEMVDGQIREIKAETSFSNLTSTVLAAMNMADKFMKARKESDNLRQQIRSYADECAKLRAENKQLRKNKA